MNSRRSLIDSINAGRPRRAGTSLEEIALSLQTLGERLDNSGAAARNGPPSPVYSRNGQPQFSEHNPARASEHQEPRYEPVSPPRQAFEPSAYQAIASDIGRMREREEAIASAGKIATELKMLREDLRQQMMSGIREEFDTLRGDFSRAMDTGVNAQERARLSRDIERISTGVQSIAEKGDDQRIGLLRQDIEDMRQALDRLARESSPAASERRWEDFDRRWTAFETRVDTGRAAADPQIGALADRLQEISTAVDGLPESLSVRSLEERVRMLANNVEQFMRRQESQAPETLRQLEQRLDEITRAIVASAVSTPIPTLDPEPFQRIEARISSLARQIEEILDDRPSGEVIERINTLSQRVDLLAEQGSLPDPALEALGRQIQAIAGKLERVPEMPDATMLFDGIEQRFDLLSTMMERRQGDAIEQGNVLFHDLERRLDELAMRIDMVQPIDQGRIMDAIDARFGNLAEKLAADSRRVSDTSRTAIDGIERRLEDISLRLDASSAKVAGIDPKLIRSLEGQVAALSDHLRRPAAPLPEMEDIAPRLGELEKAIAGNRESIMSAARQAAEAAVRTLDAGAPRPETSALAQDVKSLEALTRRSDERNAKTFEAIHDTLIKIVDRLGAVDATEPTPPPATRRTVAKTPSIDIGGDMEPMHAEPRDPGPAAPQAAEAVVPPLDAETAPLDRTIEPRSKLLGGFTRAFTRKSNASQPQADQPQDGTGTEDADLALDAPLDPRLANRPLEPGSGTPDLNTILRKVRDEKASISKTSETDAGKADFIAAARRAAQAAAAEAEISKRSQLPAKSGKPAILDRVRANRKPLLMAATAVMVVLAGMQVGKAYLGSGSADVEKPSMVAEQAAVNERAPVAATSMQVDPTAGAVRAAATDTAKTDATSAVEASSASDAVQMPAASAAGIQDMSPISATPPIAASAPAAMPEASEASEAPTETPAVDATAPAADVPVDAGPVTLREAAAGGDAKALFEIGARYSDGRGVKADAARAAEWYEKSAALGLPPAQYRIGNIYEKGLGVDRDVAKARGWYEKAAAQGNVSAMHNLAVLFAMGADGKPDNQSAVRWFTEAAEHGVKDSQFNLGILTAKGVGTKQDLEKSYVWFAVVAKSGDRDAAAKRDEIANSLRPEQLERARTAAEKWVATPVDAQANTVEVPDSWKEAAGATASIDMKKAIGNIQKILNKNGYDAGGSDGVMGDKTKQAIKAFQKDNGMAATGEVDEKLVRTLLAKK